MNFGTFIALTLVVHAILILSVFDIYFTSPVIHDAQDFLPETPAPASRLVLFVADGLRADTFFKQDVHQKPSSPYLRDIIFNHGMWGVSHTRPPTESRPCHVAMTSGFYEDPSALFKGWKSNPVDFDNVFNKSRYTWAFGSHEVIPIFARGPTLSHYEMHIYKGDSDDNWVFKEFTSFLKNANPNSHLHDLLLKEKIIFFLHLVATDSFGHRYGASSKEYAANVKKVDSGISDVVHLLDDFYRNDGKTAYILVSDHGMTNEGSHGSGSRAEVESPLVVWGSGVQKHKIISMLSEEEIDRTRSWGLDPTARLDVHQVDLAPLMASLIGIPVPANSIGLLPAQYLSVDDKSKAKLLLSNAKQSCELFRSRSRKVAKKSLIFLPFFKLSLEEAEARLERINQSIEARKYTEAILESERLVRLTLEGAHFYHIHHRFSLIFVVVLSFLGWIAVSTAMVFQSKGTFSQDCLKTQRLNKKLLFYVALLVLSVILVFTLLGLPTTYYFYYSLPLLIGYYIFKMRFLLRTNLSNFADVRVSSYLISLLAVLLLAISFRHRQALSLVIVLIALIGFATGSPVKTKIIWTVSCGVSAIFPLLPDLKSQVMSELVLLSAMVITIFSYVMKESRKYVVISLLPFLSGPAAFLVKSQPQRYQGFSTAIFCWLILVFSWLVPFLTSTRFLPRIITLFTCHSAVYLLLSLSYDSMFFIVFCFLLAAWVKLELHLHQSNLSNLKDIDFASVRIVFDSDVKFSPRLLCRSFVVVFFLLFALFGLGSTASLAQFNTNLLFRPFNLSKSLAFLKPVIFYYRVALPYVMIALALLCVVVVTNTSVKQLFCCALAISDGMAIYCLFLVRDSGSWLEMGTSISHYVISMSLVMSLVPLYILGKLLLTVKLC